MVRDESLERHSGHHDHRQGADLIRPPPGRRGDERAIGLFSIVELVKDRATREPLAPYNAKADEMATMNRINAFFRENGLYTFIRWNSFFVNPPLCITEEQLLEGLAIVDKGLRIADESIRA